MIARFKNKQTGEVITIPCDSVRYNKKDKYLIFDSYAPDGSRNPVWSISAIKWKRIKNVKEYPL